MPTLFTSYYEKQYKAPCCSFSSFCTLIIYIAAIILPFLFVFESGGKPKHRISYHFQLFLGLYKKEEKYWEQPDVLFRNVLHL